MNEVIGENIQSFLEASNSINSKTISLTRFQLLTLLAYFKDGVQYRELKVALGISDGKLIANLKVLKIMGYVRSFTVELDHKKLDVYTLTEQGRKELDKMTAWMQLMRNMTQHMVVENGKQSR
jgi:DNA-binding MarR family transcriptional regulator